MTKSQNNRIEQLENFLSEDKENPFLHFALAKEFEKMAQEEKALASFLHLTTVFPDYVGTYYHLGKLYERMDDHTNARKIYEQGIGIAEAAQDDHSASELRTALTLL